MENKRDCGTCKFKEQSTYGPNCGVCRGTDSGMSGWVPAVIKPLSEYTDSELEEELAKRKAASEEKERFDRFVIGDYYKITYVKIPSRFVIVRADERVTTAYSNEPYIRCTSIYDNDMNWISKPHINNTIGDKSAYTIEHLLNGCAAEIM